MVRKFRHVPHEVRSLIDTDIFWISYTHLSSTISRDGIRKTGKIMAPRIAIAHDIVPFIGEPDWRTYMFRAYHVSVTDYYPTESEHRWRNYLHHASLVWTPEGSNGVIEFFEEEKKKVEERPYALADFTNPEIRAEQLVKLDQCIELERLKQQRYAEMSDEERAVLSNPKPDIYVFGSKLGKLVHRKELFGKPMGQVPHPFAPGEIKLERYLKGMFTSVDVDETREWISGIVGGDVPVGSIDALATWEDTITGIPLRREYAGQQFYWKVMGDTEVRQKAVDQVLERL